MTTELKPCPFCGGNMAALQGMGKRYVRCDNEDCDAMGPSAVTEEEAARIWNAVPRRGGVPVAVAVEQETLHDKYVMAALTGMLANPEEDHCLFDSAAAEARKYADAAMKARGT